MPVATQPAEDLRRTLEAAIAMCRDEMDLVLQRRTRARDAYEICCADMEYIQWRQALTHLQEAHRLRGG